MKLSSLSLSSSLLLLTFLLCLLLSQRGSLANTVKENSSSDDAVAAAKLQQLCKQGAKPGFAKGVNFAPLDLTPDGGKDWFAWVKQHTHKLLEESPRSRYVTAKDDADDYPDMFGRKVDVERYDDEEELQETLEKEGYVSNLVLIHKMDEFRPKMKAVEQATGRALADADFYIAQPHAGSYGWHFDDVDNLVYCVNGTKRFRVAGTEVGSPVVVDIEMGPGDAVFVPTGYYHIGVGGDEPSIIFSIGLINKYWEDTFGGEFLNRKGEFDKEMAFEMMEAKESILTWEEIGSLRNGHTEL